MYQVWGQLSSSRALYTAVYHIAMYICVFFYTSGFFFSSGRGSALVLSAPGHAGSPPEHQGASVGPSRGPWHVLWGFKVAKNGKVTTGRHSEHVEPSSPMQTHVQAKKISDGLHMSFIILLTARTDRLATSWSCASVPLSGCTPSHGARPILPASVCLAPLEAHFFVVRA